MTAETTGSEAEAAGAGAPPADGAARDRAARDGATDVRAAGTGAAGAAAAEGRALGDGTARGRAPVEGVVPGRAAGDRVVPGRAPVEGAVPGGRAADGGAGRRWAAGDRILWRYRDNADGHVHICRPVTVVRDTPDLLAVWMAPGTECVKPVLADGTPVHEEPLATRYTAPRTTVRTRWSGMGVLKLARPRDPWSVWLFWEDGWEFRSWYVNLESPRVRWSGGVDSEDHYLDISVYPDRSWLWRDEDEFAQAQRAGLMGAAQARRVREAGDAAVELIRAWASPFSDGWEHWRPDPSWAVPELPPDWDRTPARTAP